MVAWCDASVYLTFCWLTMGHRSRIPGWWLHNTNMCQCQLNEASHLFILVVVSLSLVDFVAPFKAKRIWHKRTPDPQTITILDALLCALTALLKVDLNNIKCCYTSNVVKSTSQWVTSAWREMWSYFLHCHTATLRSSDTQHLATLSDWQLTTSCPSIKSIALQEFYWHLSFAWRIPIPPHYNSQIVWAQYRLTALKSAARPFQTLPQSEVRLSNISAQIQISNVLNCLSRDGNDEDFKEGVGSVIASSILHVERA